MDAGAWYSTLVQGVFNLTPTMTWLQMAGYAGYLAVVMTLFLRGAATRSTDPAPKAPQTKPAGRHPPAGAGPPG